MGGFEQRRLKRLLRRNQRLRTWIAFVLSLFAPGLGHVFLGQRRLGLIFYGVFLVGLAVGLASFLLVPAAPVDVVFAFAVWLPAYLGPAFHASRNAQRGEEIVELSQVDWKPVLAGVVIAMLVGNGYNFAVRTGVAEAVKSYSSSMEPAIALGDRVMVNKLSYLFSRPQRGDVVAIEGRETAQPQVVFKRVIGLPGETVEIREGVLYVDGTEHPDWARPEGEAQPDLEAVEVPESEYYLLGDQRQKSQDSRVWGPIPRDQIIGRASRISISIDPRAHNIRWDRTGAIVD